MPPQVSQKPIRLDKVRFSTPPPHVRGYLASLKLGFVCACVAIGTYLGGRALTIPFLEQVGYCAAVIALLAFLVGAALVCLPSRRPTGDNN